MNPKLYALNAGRADAFILEIPDGRSARVVLIDGGDKEYLGKQPMLDFLRDRQIRKVDLLILTHLHPDHVGGLLAVAAETAISEAVLPYPEFTLGPLEPLDPPAPAAQQTLNCFRDYQTLIQLLRAQNTSLSWQHPFGSRKEWQFASTRLRQLVPASPLPPAAYPYIQELLKNPGFALPKQEELLIKFDLQVNLDSSIWLVDDLLSGEEWLLLGGDAPLPVWEQLLESRQLNPHILKVSHHGMKDSCNEWLIQTLAPRWLLITNHQPEYQAYLEEWSHWAMKANCRMFVTGSDPLTSYLLSDLPHYPRRIV